MHQNGSNWARLNNIYMHGSREKDRGPDLPPPENHKNIVFSNTGPDPLKNHKTTKPFNVGPSSARQRNDILIAFHWRAYDGSLLVVFGYPYQQNKKQQQQKKTLKKSWIPLKNLSGFAHDIDRCT